MKSKQIKWREFLSLKKVIGSKDPWSKPLLIKSVLNKNIMCLLNNFNCSFSVKGAMDLQPQFQNKL